MAHLTPPQYAYLLQPLSPARVLRLKNNSYLAQQDVRAHMIRVFGFTNWSTDVVENVLLYESQRAKDDYWLVGYRATVMVSVWGPDAEQPAHYTDSAAAENAPQPSRGDAHHLALTTAVSTAFKRACTNLGDQFGLSLYNKGQTTAFVKGTVLGSEVDPMPEVPAVTDLGEEGGATDLNVETEPTLTGLSATGEAGFFALQRIADIEEPAERAAKVAAWLVAANERGIVSETVPTPDGTVITLGRYADKVAAQGAL